MNESAADVPASRAARRVIEFGKALLVALPPFAVCFWIVERGDVPPYAGTTLLVAASVSGAAAWWARGRLSRRLRTVSSLLAAFREGDFSVRARTNRGDTLLDDVLAECNHLADTLREHRLGEMEAWTLLRRVMAEVDVVVLALSESGRLLLANDAAAKALDCPSSSLVGRDASSLGLAELLDGPAPRIVRESDVLRGGPWELRRGTFRLSGQPHSLIVLSNMSAALREQEREAWKRLIRVMGHEINNSLAPIHSLAESLQRVLRQDKRAAGWEDDVASGLSVIGRRSEALGRFMTAYGRLARLPPPKVARVEVREWVRRAAALEQRLRVHVNDGPEVSLLADADQLDQLLINLLKNAVDATLEKAGGVRVGWAVSGRMLTLTVDDDGPGVADTGNLFVPFFTTKPDGSGIGLALARQIAEAHGGDVSLHTRSGAAGAEAVVRLPLERES